MTGLATGIMYTWLG